MAYQNRNGRASRHSSFTRWRDWPRGRLVVATVLVVLAACSFVLAKALGRTPEPDPTQALTTGPSIYVAPSATSEGDGSKEDPMALATVLSGTAPVREGTTIWLRGGTYHGVFRSDLTGTEQRAIVVRAYPGEEAVIDSAPFSQPALSVHGAWTTFRDFEILNSSASRVSGQPGASQPTDLQRGPGVEVHGPYTKIVNLVVHDLAGGINIWSDAVGAEAYGNIVYANGWKSDGRNNGHGIYTQNREGVRRIADNIIFNQFATGIHAYGSSDAFLDNIALEGNVVFNNGTLGQKYDRNILIGGGRAARHPVLVSNHTYFSTGNGLTSGENNIGYLAGCADLDARDNHFIGGELGFALEMVNCTGRVEHNTFRGDLRAVEEKTLVNYPTIKQRFPENTYMDAAPAGVQVFARPNQYEPGRANIIVYNWGKARRVDVDLAQANIEPGTRFEILDAQNYGRGPVVSGTYTGAPVQIRMTGLSVAAPVGDGLDTPSHTGPVFGVFVVTPASNRPSLVARAMSALRSAR